MSLAMSDTRGELSLPMEITAVQSQGPVWSPDEMIQRVGGDEALARELVSLFLVECPRLLDTVRVAVAGSNADEIRRAAHAFKGMVANFTSGSPATVAFELEKLGRARQVNGAPEILSRLETDVELFMTALREYDSGTVRNA